jgi:hypothetical protein
MRPVSERQFGVTRALGRGAFGDAWWLIRRRALPEPINEPTLAIPNAQKGVLRAKISQAPCPSGAQSIERNGILHVSVQTMINIQKYRLPLYVRVP